MKYQRLGASVPELLSSDVASCMCASDKLLALGTKSGRVHILDFNGNEIKRFSSHAAPVNDISFDARGEFTASCADDGTVAVNGLYSDEQLLHEYGRAVKTVAIDPEYATRKSRQFVCGGLGAGGGLTMNSHATTTSLVCHSPRNPKWPPRHRRYLTYTHTYPRTWCVHVQRRAR